MTAEPPHRPTGPPYWWRKCGLECGRDLFVLGWEPRIAIGWVLGKDLVWSAWVPRYDDSNQQMNACHDGALVGVYPSFRAACRAVERSNATGGNVAGAAGSLFDRL